MVHPIAHLGLVGAARHSIDTGCVDNQMITHACLTKMKPNETHARSRPLWPCGSCGAPIMKCRHCEAPPPLTAWGFIPFRILVPHVTHHCDWPPSTPCTTHRKWSRGIDDSLQDKMPYTPTTTSGLLVNLRSKYHKHEGAQWVLSAPEGGEDSSVADNSESEEGRQAPQGM